MKKLLITSVALLAVGLLAVIGFGLLGPKGVLAEEDSGDVATEYHFGPLDDVLDQLVGEGVIDQTQADAIRNRLAEEMPHGGMHFRIEGFGDGSTGSPHPTPGTDEFDQWMNDMHDQMGDHMVRPDASTMPFGGHGFGGHGFMDPNDLQQHLDQLEEYFGGNLPEHMQDMLEQMQEQLGSGVESSVDA